MRSNVHNFINAAKAKALEESNKQATHGQFISENAKNSIFNQANYIHLNKQELLAVRESIVALQQATDLIASALAALKDFQQFETSHLRMAGNFVRGTDYMLQEFLQQQKGVSAKVCDFATRGVAR
jgi:hypothetical protein